MSFTCGEVTSERYCQIASQVTKIVIHSNPYINLFLTRYLNPQKHEAAKTFVDRSFHNFHQRRSFLVTIVASLQLTRDVLLGTVIVTSYSSIVLPRVIWWKADLH